MSKFQCYHCHKFSHYRSDCLERLDDRKRKGKQHVTTTNIDEFPKTPKNEDSGDKDFFYFSSLIDSIADSDDLWLGKNMEPGYIFWQGMVHLGENRKIDRATLIT